MEIFGKLELRTKFPRNCGTCGYPLPDPTPVDAVLGVLRCNACEAGLALTETDRRDLLQFAMLPPGLSITAGDLAATIADKKKSKIKDPK